MKTFYELPEEQQDEAIQHAIKKMRECVARGLLKANKPMTEAMIKFYGIAAAEGSRYQDGKPVVDGSDVYV